MDVVIFAGGKGTRARPAVAAVQPKHLTTIGRYPLLWHVCQTAIEGGATRLWFSINGENPGITIRAIASFELSVPAAFQYSDNASRIGTLYYLAEMVNWLKPDQAFGVLNANGYFHGVSKPDFRSKHAPHLWTVEAPQTVDISAFEQVMTDGPKIEHFVEKPPQRQSDYISTGALKLPFAALKRATKLLPPISNQEQHLGPLLEALVADGNFTHSVLPYEDFYDCGNTESIQAASARATASS